MVPSRKLTVPVGPVDGMTEAVKVTDCPEVDGFGDEFRLVEVDVLLVEPQPENWKEAMRVFQATPPALLGKKYSFVYQNVQSSAGSTDMLV